MKFKSLNSSVQTGCLCTVQALLKQSQFLLRLVFEKETPAFKSSSATMPLHLPTTLQPQNNVIQSLPAELNEANSHWTLVFSLY